MDLNPSEKLFMTVRFSLRGLGSGLGYMLYCG